VRPQTVALPWYVPPCARQNAWFVITHMPDGVQHAPVGAGVHVVPVHVVLSPLYVPPSCAHCWAGATMHAPVGRQQAPTTTVPGGLKTVP
jgi:hypothetical protein